MKVRSMSALALELLVRNNTVDREIFAVKKFSPVAWAAKIKYTHTHFTAEPSGGEN